MRSEVIVCGRGAALVAEWGWRPAVASCRLEKNITRSRPRRAHALGRRKITSDPGSCWSSGAARKSLRKLVNSLEMVTRSLEDTRGAIVDSSEDRVGVRNVSAWRSSA